MKRFVSTHKMWSPLASIYTYIYAKDPQFLPYPLRRHKIKTTGRSIFLLFMVYLAHSNDFSIGRVLRFYISHPNTTQNIVFIVT